MTWGEPEQRACELATGKAPSLCAPQPLGLRQHGDGCSAQPTPHPGPHHRKTPPLALVALRHMPAAAPGSQTPAGHKVKEGTSDVREGGEEMGLEAEVHREMRGRRGKKVLIQPHHVGPSC